MKYYDGFGMESSQKVRRAIEAHGAVPALIEILRASDAPPSAKERVFILHRFFNVYLIIDPAEYLNI